MARLFVGNIPRTSSEAELQRWVESQGFHVESAQIIRDRSTGKSRGFGFVALNIFVSPDLTSRSDWGLDRVAPSGANGGPGNSDPTLWTSNQ